MPFCESEISQSAKKRRRLDFSFMAGCESSPSVLNHPSAKVSAERITSKRSKRMARIEQVSTRTFFSKIPDEESELSGQDSSHSETIYCICNGKAREDQPVIKCDVCDQWYHIGCIGMSKLEWKRYNRDKYAQWSCKNH